jgi:hypothetical protein
VTNDAILVSSQLASLVIGKGANINANIQVSDHARKRMEQRCIREHRLSYVVEHGKVYNRSGATWHVLRLKDVPPEDRSNEKILKTVGVVVCVEFGVVSTVYFNERPSHHVRRKPKYDRRAERCAKLQDAA